MSCVSSIGAPPVYGPATPPSQAHGAEGPPATQQNDVQVAGSRSLRVSGSESTTAIQATSVKATAESGVTARSPVLSTNELIGLLLLALALQCLRNGDEEQNKGLLQLLSLILEQQNAARGGQLSAYESSSLSIESKQAVTVSRESVVNTYGSSASDVPQDVSAGTQAGSLDVVA